MSAIRDCEKHGEWVDDGTTIDCPECLAEKGLDAKGWPARWSDSTYLGDGPYGA